MPEYLAPGVYIEEIDSIKTIEGVSTSTTGFAGVTRRGPTEGPPTLVTSFPEFQRIFGGYFDFGPTFLNHRYMPFAVDGFFTNGGKRLYVSRVAAAGAGAPVAASTLATGGMIARLAVGQDVPVDPTTASVALATLRGVQVGTIIRLVMTKEGVTYTSNDLTATAITPATNTVTFAPGVTITPVGPPSFEASRTTVLTITDIVSVIAPNTGVLTTLGAITNVRANTFTISAADPGSWGNDLVVQVSHEVGGRAEVAAHLLAGADTSTFRLSTAAGFYVDAWVEINMPTGKRYRRIRSVNGTAITVWGQAITAALLPVSTEVVVCEFKVVASYLGVVEQFGGLTLEPVPGKFFVDVINNGSNLIAVNWPLAPAVGVRHPMLIPSALDGLNIPLAGGTDGNPPTALDYRGTTTAAGLHTGIKALEDIDQVSIIAAPGATDQLVQNALIEQCERLKDRFAILDPAPRAGNQAPLPSDVLNQRSLYDTKYAALYYPRLMVFDPIANQDIPGPPSGHMAGIYARTDIELGVHVAPANQVVRGILDLELVINKENQDILNPKNVNVIRDFRADGRGLRVWGARCLTSDTEWKYVPVRRLFIFLEESLDEGTQWVVFLPNDEPLWERVKQSVENFLTRVWRDGALQGSKPEEAYFVKVDHTTMTQDDIDNGRLIMIIGVAAVKPAEFVIIRIGQWSGGSSVAEG